MDSTQKDEILAEINKALRADDMETAIKFAKTFPMAPEVADALRFGFGAEALKNSGFNLSAAEEAYGKNWLD